MAKATHYSPRINRFMVSVLYHEAKARRMPMTKLADQLLAQSLQGSESWTKAESSIVRENPSSYPDNIR